MAITTLSGINAAIKKAVNTELNRRDDNSVFGAVKEAELDRIDDDVYASYSPTIYDRRYNHGLANPNNIVGENSDSALIIRNITKPNRSLLGQATSRTLAEIVEYGLAPNIFNDLYYVWMDPRPFTKNTISDLSASGAHIDAMRIGLTSQGFDVR